MVVRGHPDIVVAALCGMAVPASAMPNRKNYPRACGRGTRARLEGLTGKQLELAPSYLTRLDGLAGWGGGIRTSAYSIGICQDSQPQGAVLTKVSGARSTPGTAGGMKFSAALISRCRDASHMKVAQKPRGTARFRRHELSYTPASACSNCRRWVRAGLRRKQITLLTALLARQLRHPECSPAKRCCPHRPQ
jgi:hypothetical protein